MTRIFSPSLMGFFLALTTALMWGILPVFLKLLLVDMDAFTITSVRFLFAGVFVFGLLAFSKGFPRLKGHSTFLWLLLIVSIVFLLINYVTNVIALNYISPSTVQLLLQLAPFILMIGGVLIYGESFSTLQIFGAIALFIGLAMFFNQRIPVIMNSTEESIDGVVIVIFSATAWALYALAQKKLLVSFTSRQLTLLIYIVGGSLLLPFSDFDGLVNLSIEQWLTLVFCCFNTIIGYGAFTHAMQIWDASKVSAIISIAPVFTYFSNKLAIEVAPNIYFDAQMDFLSYTGAVCIIAGAMLASIGKRKVS